MIDLSFVLKLFVQTSPSAMINIDGAMLFKQFFSVSRLKSSYVPQVYPGFDTKPALGQLGQSDSVSPGIYHHIATKFHRVKQINHVISHHSSFFIHFLINIAAFVIDRTTKKCLFCMMNRFLSAEIL